MIKNILLFLLITLSISNHTIAVQSTHNHDNANLNIIILDSTISLELQIPSIVLVGFEHQAETAEEKIAIKNANTLLLDSNLFSFYKKSNFLKKNELIQTKASHSNVSMIEIKSPPKENKNHTNHNHHNHNHHDHTHHDHGNDLVIPTQHSEFKLKTTYYDIETSHIHVLSTKLFSIFENLNNLSVTLLFDDTQKHYSLSKDNSEIIL